MVVPLGPFDLDCMGRRANINEFCRSKKEDGLLNGKMKKIKKTVSCEYSNHALVESLCPKGSCEDSLQRCEGMRKMFAIGLDLIHHSSVNGKISCSFSTKKSTL